MKKMTYTSQDDWKLDHAGCVALSIYQEARSLCEHVLEDDRPEVVAAMVNAMARIYAVHDAP